MFNSVLLFLALINFSSKIYCGNTNSNELSESMAEFTLSLLKHSVPFETVFFSPSSISTCLGMVYLGSKGETKNELNRIVYGGLSDSKIFTNFKNVTENLSNLPSGYTFDVANRVYSTKDEELLDSFKQNLDDNFKSDIVKVDFSKNEQCRQQINDWVKDKTQQKIKELLPKGSIDPKDTKLVLVSALYFKGDWMHKFLKNETKDAQFHTSANEEFNVSMMQARNNDFHFWQDQDVQVLGIPFKNETLFMYFILPKERFALKQVEEQMTGKRLLDLFNKTTKRDKVFVKIPKFKLEKEFPLKRTLINLNITDLFTRSADLSGIFGKRNLHVSNGFHRAVIEVNEEGSEAAAATAVVVNKFRMAIISPPEFIADHPFMFAIVHRETNSILFFGRFANSK